MTNSHETVPQPSLFKIERAVQLLRERNIKFEEHLYLKLGIHDDDIDLLSHLPNIVRINDIDESEIDNVEDPKEVKLLTNNLKLCSDQCLLMRAEPLLAGLLRIFSLFFTIINLMSRSLSKVFNPIATRCPTGATSSL